MRTGLLLPDRRGAPQHLYQPNNVIARLTGQSSSPNAIEATVGRNRFIAPLSLRVAQCASLIAPYAAARLESGGYWIARSSRAMTRR
jgi:hypothetical protein